MGIRDFLDRLRHKKEKYREFEENMKVEEHYYEKRKSANERELEKYMKEAREKEIKAQLEKFRAAEQHDLHNNHQILNVKNMFEKSGDNLLKQPKLFSHKGSIMHKEQIFFK